MRGILEHPAPLPGTLLSVLAAEVVDDDAEALIRRADLPADLSRALLDRCGSTSPDPADFAVAHASRLRGAELVAFLAELCDKGTTLGFSSRLRARVPESLRPSQVTDVLASDCLPAIALVAGHTLPPHECLDLTLRAYELIRSGAVQMTPEALFEHICDSLDLAITRLVSCAPVLATTAILAAPCREVVWQHCERLSTDGERYSDPALTHLLNLELTYYEELEVMPMPLSIGTVIERHGHRLPRALLARVKDHPLARAETAALAAAQALGAAPDPRLVSTRSGAPVARLLDEMGDAEPQLWSTALTLLATTDALPLRVSAFVAVARGVHID